MACLAMLLGYFGHRTDVATLRRLAPTSSKGLTLMQIGELAERAGLTTRAIRLELSDIGKIRAPCILHWRMNHFVVLEKVCRRCVRILDPATGRRRLTLTEVSDRFTGVAMEVTPTATFSPLPAGTRLTLSVFFRNAKGLSVALMQLGALSIALQVFTLTTPFFSQLVIDNVVMTADTDLLLLSAVAFLGLATFIAVTAAFRSWVIIYLSSTLSFGWSSSLFKTLLNLPYDYFEKRHIGDIQSRFASLNSIRDLLTTQIVEAVIDGVLALTTLLVLFLYQPLLAVVAVLSVAIYFIIRGLLYAPLRRASQNVLVRNAARETHFLESIRGILAIKNFGNELFRRNAYDDQTAHGIAAVANAGRLQIWGDFANRWIFGSQNVVLIWLAALEIIAGRFTVGMLIAFLAYKTHFVSSANGLVDKFFRFRLARVHLDRLADIVQTQPETVVPQTSSSRRVVHGQIQVQSIAYRYGVDEPFVLRNVELCIEAGEHVAITGPSGAGKSTLLKLLVGLTRPTSGTIQIDGLPLESVGLNNYRKQIGVVMQNDQLLGGTLLDNIAFFSPQPDREQVAECCRVAGVHDQILRMPMAYDTLVGDMGDVLSGGQKQRILLARALYRNPRILFLDEATSHLDTKNEKHLVNEISGMQMTRVVVAHRAETLRHADRIIELTGE